MFNSIPFLLYSSFYLNLWLIFDVKSNEKQRESGYQMLLEGVSFVSYRDQKVIYGGHTPVPGSF